MRYHLYLITVFFFIVNSSLLWSQCPEGNITFNSQSAIDNFPSEFPNCTILNGNVRIQSSDTETPILNLTGLNTITNIEGSLSIVNTRINDLEGLNNLTTIGNTLYLLGNDQMSSLSGLEQLKSIGHDFSLFENNQLIDLSSLSALETVGRDFVLFGQTALPTLNGLQQLTTIGGEFALIDNLSLRHLDDLSRLSTIGGGITLDKNLNLININGLSNIQSIGGNIEIVNHPNLITCANAFLCAYPFSESSATIKNNATGCNTIAEIENTCALPGCSSGSLELLIPDTVYSETAIPVQLITPSDLEVANISLLVNGQVETLTQDTTGLYGTTVTFNSFGEFDQHNVKAMVEYSNGCVDSLSKDVFVQVKPIDDSICDNFGATINVINASNNQANGRIAITPVSGLPLSSLEVFSDLNFELVDTMFMATNVPTGIYEVELVAIENSCSKVYRITVRNETDCSDFSLEILFPDTVCHKTDIPIQLMTTPDIDIDTISLTVNGQAETLTQDASGIYGTSLRFAQYFGGVGSRSLKAKVTYSNGCVDSVSQFTYVMSNTGNFTYSVDGLTVTFSPYPLSQGEIYTYFFSFGDNRGLASSGEDITYTYSSPGKYDVFFSAIGECVTETLTETITLEAPIDCSNISATVNELQSDCNELLFEAIVSGGTPPYAYNWTADNENTNSQFSADFFSLVGDYNVTITDASGCSALGSFEVEQGQGPIADFDYSITSDSILLSNLSQGEVTDIQWTFNTPDRIANNRVPLPPPGLYEICLRVSGQCTHTSNICKEIRIEDPTNSSDTLPNSLSDYPWLTTVVDFENCGDTKITVFESRGYIYLWVEASTSNQIYNAAGTPYCTNTPTFNCFDFYSYDREISAWNCGATTIIDEDKDGVALGTDPDDNDPCVPNAENAACSNQTFPPFLDDYSTLTDLVDFNNCLNTTITVFKSRGYDYLLIETASSSIMYNTSGVRYCTNSPNYDCFDGYPLDELIAVWTCGDSPSIPIDSDADGVLFENDPDDNDPCIPNTNSDNCNPTIPQLFDDFPFLVENGIIDPLDCKGAKITVYTQGIYSYIYVETATSFVLYNASGQTYCTGSSTYSCAEAYGFTTIAGAWECGNQVQDIDQDGFTSDTDPDDTDPCIPDNSSLDCQSGSTTPQIFEDYPFLISENIVNPFDCDGEQITVYTQGIYSYIYVETTTSFVLYNEIGQRYCTGSPTYSCPEAYGFTTIAGAWECGALVIDADKDGTPSDVDPDDNDPCLPNQTATACVAGGTTPPIFEEYDWLTNIIDPFDCQGGMVQVYRSGGFVYVFIETPTSARLYNAAGAPYCTNSTGYDCRDFYTVDEMITTWTCGDNTIDEDLDGVPSDSDPNDNDPCIPNDSSSACQSGELPQIFTTYDWLNDYVNPFNCSTERITVYVAGSYKYLNVETPTSTILYTASGVVQCTSGPGYDCVSLYGFTEIESVWECGNTSLKEAKINHITSNKTTNSATAFQLYPNPTQGYFNVDIATNREESQMLRILDLQGRLLQQINITNKNKSISFDLSNQAKGVYLVQLISKKEVHSKRIIVD